MPRQQILVVDDEEDIRELVEFNLTRNGYAVNCVETGEQALKAIAAHPPDLVLLDLMLPGCDGLTVCREIKANPRTKHVPVIMLTAKGEEADVVTGLEVGADDYMAKPFSPRVLLARVRAVLRRKHAPADGSHEPVKHGPLTIHPGRFEVLCSGKPVDLTRTEFGILHLLTRQPGWVYTRSQIVNQCQGENAVVTDRSVDVHIVSIRRKLGAAGAWIETVRGVGYRLKDE